MSRVRLRLGDLREAASQYGKLTKTGSGSVSKRTTIKSDSVGISVETPHLEMSVVATGRWGEPIDVDCVKFRELLDHLKKSWADIGGDNAQIELSATATSVEVSWSNGQSTRRHAMPAWPPPPAG